MSVMRKDAEYLEAQDLHDQDGVIAELVDIFALPSGGTEGTSHDSAVLVSKADFVERVGDERVQAQLSKAGVMVDSSNAAFIFDMLDRDNNGRIDLEELVTAFANLSGNARQLTLVRLTERVKQLQRAVQNIHDEVGNTAAPATPFHMVV